MACRGDMEREKKLQKLNCKYRAVIYMWRTLKSKENVIKTILNMVNRAEECITYIRDKSSNRTHGAAELATLQKISANFDDNTIKELLLNYCYQYRKQLYVATVYPKMLNTYKAFVERLAHAKSMSEEERNWAVNQKNEFIQNLSWNTMCNTLDKNFKFVHALCHVLAFVANLNLGARSAEDKVLFIQLQAMFQLDKIHNNAKLVRQRNRCALDGRARAYNRFTNLGRHAFRELVADGMLPGFKKASW